MLKTTITDTFNAVNRLPLDLRKTLVNYHLVTH